MNSLFGRIVGATLVCVAFYALTQRLLGPVVWLFLAVVIGVAFSRILIDVGRFGLAGTPTAIEILVWHTLPISEPCGSCG